MAAAGILYPAAALRPPANSILHPTEAARPPAISFLRLPSRRAHLRAVALSRPASPVLRCAPSGESACVAQDQEYEYVVVAPPWVPSEEECKKFLELDFSPAAVRERFRSESVQARAAVVGAVVDVLRPLWDNFRDLRNLKYVQHAEEFQIGMPFGALMTCIGMYHLWRVSPNLCLNVAMPYAFYKLSVLAADVRRRGFSPDLIIRIKFAIAMAMCLKDHHLHLTPLDCFVRMPVYFIYFLSVSFELIGEKKMAKYVLFSLINDVVTMFQKPKLMKVPKMSSGPVAKRDGELVQCVHEPENPRGVKQCDQILQLVSSSANQDGEALPSFSAPDNHMYITVQQEGKLMQCVHEPENPSGDGDKEDGQILQLVSEPNDSSSAKQDGEVMQCVHEPENPSGAGEKEDGQILQVCEPNDASAKQDGGLVQCVHERETSIGEKEGGQILQVVSEPNDVISEQQDDDIPQSVSAADNHPNITVHQEGETLQLFVSEPENL